MIVIPSYNLPNFIDFNIHDQLNRSTYHLFQNDYTPTVDSMFDEFQECDFNGYQPLASNAWGGGFTNPAGYGETRHPILTWTCFGGSQTIFGYYVLDQGDHYLFAERNPGGPVTISMALQYFVLPRFQVRNWPITVLRSKQ